MQLKKSSPTLGPAENGTELSNHSCESVKIEINYFKGSAKQISLLCFHHTLPKIGYLGEGRSQEARRVPSSAGHAVADTSAYAMRMIRNAKEEEKSYLALRMVRIPCA